MKMRGRSRWLAWKINGWGGDRVRSCGRFEWVPTWTGSSARVVKEVWREVEVEEERGSCWRVSSSDAVGDTL
jgi:hypothetical protein